MILFFSLRWKQNSLDDFVAGEYTQKTTFLIYIWLWDSGLEHQDQ